MTGDPARYPRPIPRRPASAFVAKLARVSRSSPQETIMDELRRVILSGDASPGMAIPLEAVATAFGVSVIPVRESLKTLVGEGLVDHRPRAGYTVARLTMAELLELYVIRGVLEQAAVGVSVSLAGDSDQVRARQALDRLGACLRGADQHAYHRESRGFHLALVVPAGMPRLQAMLESAWNITEPYRPMSYLSAAERSRLHDDHQHMLDAFVAGDADRLRRETAEHYDRLRIAVARLPRDPELFADPQE